MAKPRIIPVEKKTTDGRVFRSWWECSNCQGEVKPFFRYCPHCGKEFLR